MSKQDPADQVKFLVCCISNTTNGRPDFTAVAYELNIVSKAAAQKRYERMLKANGVVAKPPVKAASSDDSTSQEANPVKKRKLKAEPKIKPEPKARTKRAKTVKKEGDDDNEDTKDSKNSKSWKPFAYKEEEDVKDESGSEKVQLSDSPKSDSADRDM